LCFTTVLKLSFFGFALQGFEQIFDSVCALKTSAASRTLIANVCENIDVASLASCWSFFSGHQTLLPIWPLA